MLKYLVWENLELLLSLSVVLSPTVMLAYLLILGSIWRRAFQVYNVSAMGIYAQYISFILLPQ